VKTFALDMAGLEYKVFCTVDAYPLTRKMDRKYKAVF
jgi:hypothetical protein